MNCKIVRFFCLLILFFLGFAQSSVKSILTIEQAQVVQKLVRSNSIIIHHCEDCESKKVEIWHLKKMLVDLKEGSQTEYRLQAYGTKLYQSQKALLKGESDQGLFFRSYKAEELEKSFLIELDINHIYIPSESYKSFLLLSNVMEVNSKSIRNQIKIPQRLIDLIRKNIK